MSLWQVPDKQTAELMELFYKNWLIEKMSTRAALASAQKTMRDKKLEPYYWAGFVLME
ncbi:MAG: CHAT domain-containing protein [Saprospiraceae bacterium]|nr:CHAT domain-containing protein [Saprospiraceae bacterium]